MATLTENRVPTGFTPDRLGQAVTGSGGYTLVSYLSSPVYVDSTCDYVILGDTSTPLEFVRSFITKANNTKETFIPIQEGHFRYIPKLAGELTVSVEVKRNDVVVDTLTMVQMVVPPDAILENMIVSGSPSGTPAGVFGAAGGNPAVSREIINNFRRYLIGESWRTGKNGIPPMLIAAVAYLEVLKKPYEFGNGMLGIQGEISRFEELDMLTKEINAGTFVNFDRAGSLGVCGMTPHMAAMAAGLIPFTELPPDTLSKFDAGKQILEQFAALTPEQKADVFNLLRFPKSNISLCATYLTMIKNRTNRWPATESKNLADTTVPDNVKALKVISTEFNIGPESSTKDAAFINGYGEYIVSFLSAPVLSTFFSGYNSYLLDDAVTLRANSIDKMGEAANPGKKATVPSTYVYDLQKDLLQLGFEEVGPANGVFGPKTVNALHTFQRAAASGYRKNLKGDTVKMTNNVVTGTPTDVVDKNTRDEILLWLEEWYTRPDLYGCYQLYQGDSDAQKTWGGVRREDDTGTHAADLQRDLVRLGYWVSAPDSDNGMHIDGDCGSISRGSIWLFQREHSFTNLTGRLELDQAFRIKEIIRGLKPSDVYTRPGYKAPASPNMLFQLPPSPNYTHYDPYYSPNGYTNDIWGRREFIDCIIKVTQLWVNSGKQPLRIGDLSCDDGSGPEGHNHVRGEMGDVSHPIYCQPLVATFDRYQAEELVGLWFSNGVMQILSTCKYLIDTFDNNPSYPGKNVKAWENHHHHFHVDYYRLEVTNSQVAFYCQQCAKNVRTSVERATLNSEWTRLSAGMSAGTLASYPDQASRDAYVREHSDQCFYVNRTKVP